MRFYVVNRIPIKRRVRFNPRNGRTYTDAQTTADLNAVAGAYKGERYLCPVAIIAFVYKQLPKARWRKGIEPFDCKPDLDNVLKAIMDGLNGIAYADDKQVTSAYIRKLDRESIAGEYVKFTVIPADRMTGVLVDGELTEDSNEFQ